MRSGGGSEPGPPRLGEKVLGFRQWTLGNHGLRPLVASLPYTWGPGPNQARCLRSQINPNAGAGLSEHRAPDPNCHCGLYAYHAPSRQPPAGDAVSGAVLAWGHIEVHPTGFRAEFAEPVVLAYHGPTPDHLTALRSMAEEFCLPVVAHADLAAAAGGLGQPVPSALRPPYPIPAPASGPLPLGVSPLAMADELLMVSLSDHDGPRVGFGPAGLDMMVAGAELAELAARGRVAREGDRIRAVGRAPTGDSGLDATLATIGASHRPRSAAWWIAHLAETQPAERRLHRLYGLGLADQYDREVRGLFSTKTVPTWFVPEGGPEVAMVERWQAALSSGRADPRTATLLAIVYGSGVRLRWFAAMKRRELKRRMALITRDRWIPDAVAGAISSHQALSLAANGSL